MADDGTLLTTLAKVLVCRCEDVPYGELAAQPGWRAAKLHTRCGMGPCQGRICGTAVQTYFGWDIAVPRPPHSPTRIGAWLEADRDMQPVALPEDDARL